MGWNDQVIEQLREGRQRIADRFDRDYLLLLGTTGAKSGEKRLSPVAQFKQDDDHFLVIASYAGRPENPAWYHNLVANPQVTVERWDGDDYQTFDAVAAEVEGPERERLWAEVTAKSPGFADYQTKVTRQIPLVMLTRV